MKSIKTLFDISFRNFYIGDCLINVAGSGIHVMLDPIDHGHDQSNWTDPHFGLTFMAGVKMVMTPLWTTTSPGHIPFSPCWFNGANVLSVSQSLRGWPNGPTVEYLHKDHESLSLLGAVLALIHPQLAAIGLSVLRGFQKNLIHTRTTKNLGPVRLLYPSPSTAFSIISNRETPLHRDGKGYSPYYDIITTLGDYTDGRLEVPGVGLRFKYNPGTIVGICGKVLAHGVGAVNGDRFCHVQYFHRRVLDVIAEKYPVNQWEQEWMTQCELVQDANS